MATTEPQKWSATLGANADVNSLPATTPAGSGRASTSGLFPQITQKPLDEGGIAPERADFNALFKYLGDYIYYVMQGGVFSYLSTYTYTAGNLAMFSGAVYECIAANGPGNVHAPTDTSYWRKLATLQDIPPAATVNDGQLTINVNGSAVATFTANQAGNSTADITVPAAPTVNNGELKINVNGSTVATFTANQVGNTTADITISEIESQSVSGDGGWVRFKSGIQIVFGAGTEGDVVNFPVAFVTLPRLQLTCPRAGNPGHYFAMAPGWFERTTTYFSAVTYNVVNSRWETGGNFDYIAIGFWK